MNETASSNIQQIISSFTLFDQIHSDCNWVKNAKTEDVKTAFKLALFLEKTVEHFNNSTEFTSILNKDIKFYSNSCDKLLEKCFKSPDVSETTLDVAVRMYSTLFHKERFKSFLSSLILESSSFAAISNFALNSIQDIDKNELEFRIKLNYLTNNESEISNYLSYYKIELHLNMLIGILTLKSDLNGSEERIQKIILNKILEIMLDRSVLSKPFWLTLFKTIEIEFILSVCLNFSEFFDSYVNFIVYLGSMMEKEQICEDLYVWKSVEDISLVPEISYYDLLYFLRFLGTNSSVLHSRIKERLVIAKELTELVLWDDIINALY